MTSPVSRLSTPERASPSRLTPTSPPRESTRGTMGRPPSARAAASSPIKPRPRPATGPARAAAEAITFSQDDKEKLLLQVQDKDQSITTLTTNNYHLSSALKEAEARLHEVFGDQARAEEEMAARIEVADKLRAQLREVEKEKRDIQKRYTEQTSTFEAERQAFYDNEQHLKSRIQSLTQARMRREPSTMFSEPESEAEQDDEEQPGDRESVHHLDDDMDEAEDEPAEMSSLKLELSTLSTSYTSMQSTLLLLQTQLVDLKRVNHELQEENESYMILLREKTLSGQFDLMRQVGGGPSTVTSDDDDDDRGDMLSLRSTTRSTLDPVEEEQLECLEDEWERSLEPPRDTDSPRPTRHSNNRAGRKHGSHSPSTRGESLADLPITGPGLDLAAELGRAENKDILEGNVVEERDASVLNGKGKRGKKSSSESRRGSDSGIGGLVPSASVNDIDALRTEVKSLKDANKALSLYASKIIDRIISQEGFEHVLAVDYEKPPPTPATPFGASTFAHTAGNKKPRPASVIVGRSISTPGPETPTMAHPMTASASTSPPGPPPSAPRNKSQRRSLSFDWSSFSLFGGDKKIEPTLKPLTLGTGAGNGARKLDTHEDDDDRRERDRLAATMKLMGIEQPQPAPPPTVPMVTSFPVQQGYVTPVSPPLEAPSRFSFFRRNTVSEPPTESAHSAPGSLHDESRTTNLTHEALETAEAEQSLAALDAHERQLSAEIAKGGSPATMFTEIAPRVSRGEEWRSRRSRKSGGSGSTVWSAKMTDED